MILRPPPAAALALAFALFASLVHAAPAPSPSDPPVRQRNGVLVDLKGRGLYTYAADTEPGRSRCDAQCAILWPPLLAPADAHPRPPFSTVVRSDGTRQWAWKAQPLYRWRGDRKRGDAGGDGVAKDWKLVHLEAQPAALLQPPNPGSRP